MTSSTSSWKHHSWIFLDSTYIYIQFILNNFRRNFKVTGIGKVFLWQTCQTCFRDLGIPWETVWTKVSDKFETQIDQRNDIYLLPSVALSAQRCMHFVSRRQHLAHLATCFSLLAVEMCVVFLVILTSFPHQMHLLILTRHSKCTESTLAKFSSWWDARGP